MVDSRLRELVLITESVRTVETVDNVHETSSIPVISHTTTIVDMTSSVLEHLERKKQNKTEIGTVDKIN